MARGGGAGADELRNNFRPEFLNRVDDIIVFRPLQPGGPGARSWTSSCRALEQLLAGAAPPARGHAGGAGVSWRQGYDPVYGARPLKRVIQRELQNPIALEVLEGTSTRATRLRVEREGDTCGWSGRRGPRDGQCVGAPRRPAI
jgi:ATP-dependent Clp protease ATP-binding subunit ClpB